GERRLHVGKALLHVEAAESRQVNVEDQAVDRPEAPPREEFLAGAKGIHREACGAQQPPQGAEDRRIVVDNRDALTQETSSFSTIRTRSATELACIFCMT